MPRQSFLSWEQFSSTKHSSPSWEQFTIVVHSTKHEKLSIMRSQCLCWKLGTRLPCACLTEAILVQVLSQQTCLLLILIGQTLLVIATFTLLLQLSLWRGLEMYCTWHCEDSLYSNSPVSSRAPDADVPFRFLPSVHCHPVAADRCVCAPLSARKSRWLPDLTLTSAAAHCAALRTPSPAMERGREIWINQTKSQICILAHLLPYLIQLIELRVELLLLHVQFITKFFAHIQLDLLVACMIQFPLQAAH